MGDEEHSDSEFYYPDEACEESTCNKSNETENGNPTEQPDSQEFIENFVIEQKSSNTMKKTSTDVKTFQRFVAAGKDGSVKIEALPAKKLDHLLSKFFIQVRKRNGEEYEPGTLSGIQRSVQRWLSEHKSPLNILKDQEFEESRKVLAAKRKQLVNVAGKGNKPNATKALTDEEEDQLFKSGQLGETTPDILQRTVWWFLALHFGFRARDESRKLCWGDIELQQDPIDGREFLVWLAERGTKTRKGQENGHQRVFKPKAYATESERCPLKFYKLFKSHRPAEMNSPEAPFFLAVNHNTKDEIWYKKAPLGKNQIGKFLKTAASNAGIVNSGGKISNHSVRKTQISRLMDANTPEIFITQLSGHKSIDSLQSYKSASSHHQRQMSCILSRTESAASAHNQLTSPQSVDQRGSGEICASSVQRSTSITGASNPAIFAGANITNCQFQVFNGPVKIIQESRKRHRAIIESDGEED